jgi:hypothetical protein
LQLKEEFHEPRYSWPVLKLLKLLTGKEEKADQAAVILDCLNLSEHCHQFFNGCPLIVEYIYI